MSNKDKTKWNAYMRDYWKKNPTKYDRFLLNQKDYYKKNKTARIIYQTQYNKNNPVSNCCYPTELRTIMNNVRKRDNNTCQWQGCGLTHRQAPIHVHHIFPRNEYQELELVEQYMICYCANHHGLWHRYRGDYYSELILSQMKVYNS